MVRYEVTLYLFNGLEIHGEADQPPPPRSSGGINRGEKGYYDWFYNDFYPYGGDLIYAPPVDQIGGSTAIRKGTDDVKFDFVNHPVITGRMLQEMKFVNARIETVRTCVSSGGNKEKEQEEYVGS